VSGSPTESVTIIDTKAIADQLLAKLFTRFPALFRRWVRKHRFVEFADTPWTPFSGKINHSRVALLTTAGVHLKRDPAFNMRDPAGDPSFREIPTRSTPADLTITHNYYDHRDADTDINVVFPLERLTELDAADEIGSVNWRHFSFMGHILPPHLHSLITVTAPQVAGLLKRTVWTSPF
jgi:D-proline reductase (dithiol) PrdB